LIFVLFLVDLRNELTKEQDCRQKLEHDILELRRVRSTEKTSLCQEIKHFIFLDVLIKKLKRLNRSSSTTGNCSNSNGNTKSKK
jgi:hypothetical protein